MKLYVKVIGGSCYTCLPQTVPAAQNAQRKVAAPSTGAPLVAQRILTNTWPKTRQQHKHTSKQMITLRNSTSIHKNSTLNLSKTILRVTAIAIAWI